MSAHFKFRRLWLAGSIAAAVSCLMAQVPQSDSRNINVPNTDTHFAMPAYRTLADWEAHQQKLRAQILFAAGADSQSGGRIRSIR